MNGQPSFPSVPPSLLAHLNPEQLAAVTLPAEPALILAGAGSGKTRVLTTRIAWLLQTGQCGPGGLMAVTFTNKAAKEMVHRLSTMLPVNVRGMWIGTFHGLCNRFLRAHWKLANLPQSFQILDSGDQLSAVKRIIKAMNQFTCLGTKRSSSRFMPLMTRLTALSVSPLSRIWKLCGRPASFQCARRKRLHRPWKVPIH
ncbi:MAG: hypothetical protein RLZZ524_204, partial [Pseudomonadota bacterium]